MSFEINADCGDALIPSSKLKLLKFLARVNKSFISFDPRLETIKSTYVWTVPITD